jgi:hypothetical protein
MSVSAEPAKAAVARGCHWFAGLSCRAAGWTYVYHYFDRFGIPPLMVDIPKENYFVYGLLVVWQFPLWALGLGLALLIAATLWRWIAAALGRAAMPLGLAAIVV